MKFSTITTCIGVMFFMMTGQASGNQRINCQIIVEGICINYVQLSYRTQFHCVNDKNTECLEYGYYRKEVLESRELSLAQNMNCFEQDETEIVCIYINGANNPCINFHFQVTVLYCLV